MEYPRYRGLEKKEVFFLRIAEGTGTAESIVRIVTYILDLNGEVIARLDPELKPQKQKKEKRA